MVVRATLSRQLLRWAAVVAWLGMWAPGAAAESDLPTRSQLATWGEETLAAIDRDYKVVADGGSELYAEAWNESDGRRRARRAPAFMWSAGVHLSALVAAARFDANRFREPLKGRIASLAPYWHDHGGVGGYDVLPRSGTADRYYDDNAWIALALLEATPVLNDEATLMRAKKTQAFVLSGEDDALGGGVYWRENERTSKNTCSNAPAALAALLLHEATGRAVDRTAGKRLANWTKAKLQDPATGLYWDNVNLDGAIDRRLFSYNSAIMIRVNLKLHALTRDAAWLTEAERIGRAAEARWIDAKTHAFHDGGRFAHMLLEALLEVAAARDDEALHGRVLASVAYVHDEIRDAEGRYANRWDEPAGGDRREFKLIDQASAARLYFAASLATKRSPPAPGD